MAANTETAKFTTKPVDTTARAPNGSKPETAPMAGQATPTAETEGASEKRRGVVPTMPAALVYRLTGRVYAGIFHPVDESSYVESGKGEGSAIGALVDSGFRISALTLDGPEWLAAKLPAGAELIGYGTVKGFPLPVQGK